MSNNNKLISFTMFSRECFFKEGMDNDPVYKDARDDKDDSDDKKYNLKTKQEIIDQATTKRLGKYRETMEAFSINFGLLKENNHVYIPNNQKAAVKWIINNYTGSVIRTYRTIHKKINKLLDHKNAVIDHNFQGAFEQERAPNSLRQELDTSFKNTDLGELRTVIEHISSILTAQLSGSVLHQELNNLYRNSLIMFKEVMNQVNHEIVPSISKQVENTMYFAQNGNTLNDLDRLILLQYYTSIINNVNEQFRNITKITAELRNEELVNLSVVENGNLDDKGHKQLWLQLSDFHEILEEAINIYKEDQ